MSAAAPARQLQTVPCNCRFYGHARAAGKLVATGGNQCALLSPNHAPCQMERSGNPIDETRCPLVRLALEAAGVPIEETKQ
jgi:hypothetical protein